MFVRSTERVESAEGRALNRWTTVAQQVRTRVSHELAGAGCAVLAAGEESLHASVHRVQDKLLFHVWRKRARGHSEVVVERVLELAGAGRLSAQPKPYTPAGS
jgi:hypothetical protein